MGLKIAQGVYDEAKALVAGGDIDLNERRRTYQTMRGRATSLDDDKLMVASMTEDNDDELFVAAVETIEAEGYDIVADEPVNAA